MDDFEKLGHFFAKLFFIEYFDEDCIYLSIRSDDLYEPVHAIFKLSYDDYDFLKKYLDILNYGDLEDERK